MRNPVLILFSVLLGLSAMWCLPPCVTPALATPLCSGDIEPDGDVDGSDLSTFATAFDGTGLNDFALSFGRSDCPYCGNGVPETGEECDDGNTMPWDGCDQNCMVELPNVPSPLNLFNIGNSIGEGEAADGVLGSINHDVVWSSGYGYNESVYSLNERFEDAAGDDYYENSNNRDSIFNQAVSGSDMGDFIGQVDNVIAAASATPSGAAGMVTILLGNNDVCTDNVDDPMTDPALFEQQYRLGLNALSNSPVTRDAYIHISSIPAIYWLWNAKRGSFVCRFIVWPFVPCQNLLDDPADDCESSDSRRDPDTIYPGDGSDCRRRKMFHAAIRDVYNPILRDVLLEYKLDGRLPNAYFVDIFDIKFDDNDINDGDCFHPSEAGHRLLAEEQWCRSPWGLDDSMCLP
jgi:cysteine-rich repeat protein